MEQTVATSSGKAAFAMNMVPKLVCLAHLLVLGGFSVLVLQGSATWDARGTRFFALLGLGAVSIAHVFGLGWPVKRRSLTGFAAVILTGASVLAVRTGSGIPRAQLLSLGLLGLACTLNAAACIFLLQGLARGAMRFSARIVFVVVIGVLGLGIALTNARTGPTSALFVTLLTLLDIIALTIGAALLEAATSERNRLHEARLSRDLLTGVFLSMVAIAAASLGIGASAMAKTLQPMSAEATWYTAIAAARMGWQHVFSVVFALFMVFLRRSALAGIGALAATGNWPALAFASVLVVGFGRYELSASGRDIVTLAQRAALKAQREESLQARAGSEAAAIDAMGAMEMDGPDPTPEHLLDAGSDASSARKVPVVSAADASSGHIRVLGVTVDGMHEADAYGGVDRRFNFLEECAERFPEQSGRLAAKITIDGNGSVVRVVPTSGELKDTKLGECLMLSFYRMGFAAAKDGRAAFELTLQVMPR